MALQVHANVLVTDTQVALRSGGLGLFQQALLQTCEADIRPVLKAQLGRAKGAGVNFHREIAGLMGRVNHMKAVNSRSSRAIEPDILDVHVEDPFSLFRPIPPHSRSSQPCAVPASRRAGWTLFRSLPGCDETHALLDMPGVARCSHTRQSQEACTSDLRNFQTIES